MANRWAPFVDDSQEAGSDTVVNSTSFATVLSRAITAKIDTRLFVTGELNQTSGTLTTNGRAQINVTGSNVTVQRNKQAYVNTGQDHVAVFAVVDVDAGATATINLQARVTTGGDSFTAYDAGTALHVLGLPKDGTTY